MKDFGIFAPKSNYLLFNRQSFKGSCTEAFPESLSFSRLCDILSALCDENSSSQLYNEVVRAGSDRELTLLQLDTKDVIRRDHVHLSSLMRIEADGGLEMRLLLLGMRRKTLQQIRVVCSSSHMVGAV